MHCSRSGAPDGRAQLGRGCRVCARVVGNEELGSTVCLTVDVPGWRGAGAGQFALLQAEPSRCFLARALSVSDEAGERLTFMIAPVGDGTRELAGLRPGDPVWVLGPLGNGFDLEKLVRDPGRVVVVAGGVGVAPFPLVLSRLGERCLETLVLLGFRDAEQALAAAPIRKAASRLEMGGIGCRVEMAVEDGSQGPAEKVTDLLERHVRSGDRVLVCGPWAMTRAVWSACAAVPGVGVWFSLETAMACGVGSCHGCVITLADGSYARVCHEGPVFAGRELFGG